MLYERRKRIDMTTTVGTMLMNANDAQTPRLLQMKFELASGNTQQDKTTTLNHADGGDAGLAADGAQDVSSEEQDARGSAFKTGNDK
ncbi:unnamed protein product [Pleuronectes platessa]|uniref:Uncharacterized protein n=1 Tax=Pleuronectes platessa TaxID=8262 RepID=A0A9N7Z6P8_PLEPL|nr:unnamed protein product [Pleuronectes platessa]